MMSVKAWKAEILILNCHCCIQSWMRNDEDLTEVEGDSLRFDTEMGR